MIGQLRDENNRVIFIRNRISDNMVNRVADESVHLVGFETT